MTKKGDLRVALLLWSVFFVKSLYSVAAMSSGGYLLRMKMLKQ